MKTEINKNIFFLRRGFLEGGRVGGMDIFICFHAFVFLFFFYLIGLLYFSIWHSLFAGNDNLHKLTTLGMSDLYVRLETFSGDWYYAKYDDFNVANESDGYRLRLKVGSYKGNAGTLSVL